MSTATQCWLCGSFSLSKQAPSARQALPLQPYPPWKSRFQVQWMLHSADSPRRSPYATTLAAVSSPSTSESRESAGGAVFEQGAPVRWEEPLVVEVGRGQEVEVVRPPVKKWEIEQLEDVMEREREQSGGEYMTRTVRLVQWYPGHIAKAERELKEQLRLVDVIIEVRDARIPLATTHPEIDSWIRGRQKFVVMNREDMIHSSDKKAWNKWYAEQGIKVLWTNAQAGQNMQLVLRKAAQVGVRINNKRKEKGLLPRAVRCAVVGYPNVGKSALINRLLKRRVADSAPRPGVTRQLHWIRIGADLDLLDSPGVLPARIADQSAAARLAICNDIGQAAYAVAGVAALLFEIVKRTPRAGVRVLEDRYKMQDLEYMTGEEFLEALADLSCQGDVDIAAKRVLKDFRKGMFGNFALERPPQ